MKALVMGGGMSGLATAINLLDLGCEVTLIEADEIFGGRASSWLDSDGDMIDNALHVFMPYYVNLLSFFDRLGISGNIVWKDSEFYYAQKGGRMAVLKFKRLPAPLHAVYAFMNLLKDYREVPRWKVLASLGPMGLGVLLSMRDMEKTDRISMESFLAKWTSLEVMRPLMEPAINGLTFTPSHQVSARVMLNWFLKMFVSAENSRIGFANGGLGEIWVDNCLEYIRRKGGQVALGKAVTAIEMEGGRVTGVKVNGSESMTADLYVSAMSPYSLRRVLPEKAFELAYFRNLWRFQYAPSLSIQIWYDRKLTDVDVTFFSNDCVFNTYADLSNVLPHVFEGGTMFEMVISPADAVQGLPDQTIADLCLEQVKVVFPAARDAAVKKWRVVRERQGVYRPYPGMESFRPYQRSPIDNLYLTGDYTRTHVSSGGMEAAIWTANHTAELIARDKLETCADLNVEYEPYERLMRANDSMDLLALLAALMALFLVFRRRRKHRNL
ncbi:MAG: FAD-dependent oxidoreductase [Actinobacteria bacterium]|nr:FAD-dependent oxidoreductase [Actinomycetota bacterium]MBU1944905.1 FAD-dependent oxidoreductase [Actinomycetota bacterium]MBU2688109.1 FAD-dependent oxidoreductase [Actinomycetota bacterium]